MNDYFIDSYIFKFVQFQEQPETKVEVKVNELTSKSDKLKIFLKEYFDNTTSAVESALSNLENKDNGSLR